jgi:flagella basal body P-ring formation protein FlgA
MWRRILISLASLALLLILAGSGRAGSGVITFASRVEVSASAVTLLDLVSAPDSLAPGWRTTLGAVEVMAAPAPGGRAWLEGRRLREMVGRAGLDAGVSVLIPQRVEIVRVRPRVTAKMLADAYLSEIRRRLGGQFDQADVHNIKTGRGLVVPQGQVQLKVRLLSERLVGRVPAQIEVRVDGRTVGQVRASARVDLYGGVLVAARSMPRHHVITAEDVRLVKANLADAGDTVATDPDQLMGMRTRTPVGLGQPLDLRGLERAPLIRRGEVVTMVCDQGDMKITAKGEAQQTGYLGSRIKLTNLASRRSVFGKVLPSGEVQVEF